jgi:hypothetical protein
MIITFLGHRSILNCDALFEKIKSILLENTNVHEKISFYCGGYGDFDHLCARVCRDVQKNNPNCEIVFVTPYILSSKPPQSTDVTFYDSIVYPPLEKVPPKIAILRRNEWMIDQADLIIAYITYSYGGAYTGMKYAKRNRKRVINLAEELLM